MLLFQLHQSKRQQVNVEANLKRFLHTDQIEKLKQEAGPSSRGIVWTSKTIQSALSIRTAIGQRGYEYLRKMNYPLPSYRTLCRKLESTPFAPGIQHDVLQWLKLKMANMTEMEKLCILLVDEMQMKQQLEYDKGLRHMVGYVSRETLTPDSKPYEREELASHVLVFMLRGLTSTWKQTVAYLFTGQTTKKQPYWEFMQQVIRAAEDSGLRVQAITSDMGPVNVALWNEVGIRSTKTILIPYIPHPVSTDRDLYFMADPPHLLKNLWNCALVHTIKLNADVVSKYNLQCNVIDSGHVKRLISLQQGHALRLAYKLTESHTNPSQYEKMRVKLAAQFFSQSTAAALETCVKLELLPTDALTTAWFLRFVNKWFDSMNARHRDAGLFRGNTAKSQSLQDMLFVIKDLTYSDKKVWKPVQTGIQLSTTVALKISNAIMNQYSMNYFLTGRLSQDPVENLFSQVRGRGVSHPSCVMFRQSLRLITVAQYLAVCKSASYEEDGCTYLADYLKDRPRMNNDDLDQVTLNNNCTSDNLQHNKENNSELVATFNQITQQLPCIDSLVQYEEVCIATDMQCSIVPVSTAQATSSDADINTSYDRPVPQVHHITQTIGSLEGNALYDIVGWAVSKAVSSVNCDTCYKAFVCQDVNDEQLSLYTSARSYGGLTHPSKDIVDAIQLAESIFRTNQPRFHKMKDLEDDILNQIMDVLHTVGYDFPTCHGLLYLIAKKYIRLRIHEHAISISRAKTGKRQFGSKTACRITSIN